MMALSFSYTYEPAPPAWLRVPFVLVPQWIFWVLAPSSVGTQIFSDWLIDCRGQLGHMLCASTCVHCDTHTHTIHVLVGQVFFKEHRLQGQLSLSSGCLDPRSTHGKVSEPVWVNCCTLCLVCQDVCLCVCVWHCTPLKVHLNNLHGHEHRRSYMYEHVRIQVIRHSVSPSFAKPCCLLHSKGRPLASTSDNLFELSLKLGLLPANRGICHNKRSHMMVMWHHIHSACTCTRMHVYRCGEAQSTDLLFNFCLFSGK